MSNAPGAECSCNNRCGIRVRGRLRRKIVWGCCGLGESVPAPERTGFPPLPRRDPPKVRFGRRPASAAPSLSPPFVFLRTAAPGRGGDPPHLPGTVPRSPFLVSYLPRPIYSLEGSRAPSRIFLSFPATPSVPISDARDPLPRVAPVCCPMSCAEPPVGPPAATPRPLSTRVLRTRRLPFPPRLSPLPLSIQFLLMIHSSTHTTTATNN
mmetsp:Transcript_3389/g.10398  ORF Transcript_3389/g.10398 Transcript_3389/m.10398 type:complete len:209 (-) Transcript_3389:838-1464(-)